MSDPAVTITVDLDTEGILVTGDTPEFRKPLDVTLVGSGLAAASAILLALYRNTYVGVCESFSVDGDDLIGTISLNTVALEAAFAGRAATAIIPLTIRVYDTGVDAPIAQGRMACRNNLPSGFDIPTVIDPTEYMPILVYDSDEDGVIDPEALPSYGSAAYADVEDFATAAQGALADSAVQPGNIGTAAAHDAEDFASAAQGALADTAVQPEDLGSAAYEDVGAFATAAQGAKADTALQTVDLGTASLHAAEDFATAAQGALADTAVQPEDLGPVTEVVVTPVGEIFYIDYAYDRRVQNLGTVSRNLTLAKGTGWPDAGTNAHVLLKVVMTTFHIWAVDMAVPADWVWISGLVDEPGTYYISLNQVAGTILVTIWTEGARLPIRAATQEEMEVAASAVPLAMSPEGVGQAIAALATPAAIGAATAAQGELADTAIQPQRAYRQTAVDLTLASTDELVQVTVAGKTVTLPTPVGVAGKLYTIDNAAAGDAYVGTAAGTIEGEAVQELPPDSSMSVYSDGATWRFR